MSHEVLRLFFTKIRMPLRALCLSVVDVADVDGEEVGTVSDDQQVGGVQLSPGTRVLPAPATQDLFVLLTGTGTGLIGLSGYLTDQGETDESGQQHGWLSDYQTVSLCH